MNKMKALFLGIVMCVVSVSSQKTPIPASCLTAWRLGGAAKNLTEIDEGIVNSDLNDLSQKIAFSWESKLYQVTLCHDWSSQLYRAFKTSLKTPKQNEPNQYSITPLDEQGSKDQHTKCYIMTVDIEGKDFLRGIWAGYDDQGIYGLRFRTQKNNIINIGRDVDDKKLQKFGIAVPREGYTIVGFAGTSDSVSNGEDSFSRLDVIIMNTTCARDLEPHKPLHTVRLFKGDQTNKSQIEVAWDPSDKITPSGILYDIKSYHLQMLNDTTGNWVDLVGNDDKEGNVGNYTHLSYIKAGLKMGQEYTFRVRVRNPFGFGPWSNEVQFTPSEPPNEPDPAATVVVDRVNVKISWTEPENNGSPILAYHVRIRSGNELETMETKDMVDCHSDKNMYTENNNVNIRECVVSMKILHDELKLGAGDWVIADVRAFNEQGWSGFSHDNDGPEDTTARMTWVPAKMPPPVSGEETDESRIQLEWESIADFHNDAGYESIDHYELQYADVTEESEWTTYGEIPQIANNGVDYFVDVILEDEIVIGVTYQFMVRAVNIHGPGEWSDATEIKAAGPPFAPEPPTVSVDDETGYVTIEWEAPSRDGGEPIESYTIGLCVDFDRLELLRDQGAEIPDSVVLQRADLECFSHENCPGTDLEDLSCEIHMSEFWPLGFDELIRAVVAANNVLGEGEFSDPNEDGAHVQVVPFQMDPPEKGDGTSETTIEAKWHASKGKDNGGVPNDSVFYGLQIKDDTVEGGYRDLVGAEQDTWNATSSSDVEDEWGIVVSAGDVFSLRVRAGNIYGWGEWSEDGDIKAANSPAQPATVTTELNDDCDVVIHWAEADGRGEAITEYVVQVVDSDGLAHDHTLICDDADLDVFECIVPMEWFREFLPLGDLIQVRVTAINDNGPSAHSDLNEEGVVVQDKPGTMQPMTIGEDYTTESSVHFKWEALSGADAGAVAEEDLVYAMRGRWLGFDEWLEAPTFFNGTEVIVADWYAEYGEEFDSIDGVPIYWWPDNQTAWEPGMEYEMQIKALNCHGEGEWSESLNFTVPQRPEQANAPNVWIDEETGNVMVSWEAPYGGTQNITGYNIEFNDDQWTDEPTEDNWHQHGGCPQGAYEEELMCDIPMLDLYDIGINFTDILQARVRAYSDVGNGDWSESGGDADMRRTPDAPDIEPKLNIEDSVEDWTIEVSWTDLQGESAGNSPVIKYHVHVEIEPLEEESEEDPFSEDYEYSPDQTSILFEDIKRMVRYSITVQAENIYGLGEISETRDVVVSDVPDQPNPPRVTLQDKWDIKVEWDYPEDNWSQVVEYEVQFKRMTYNQETQENDIVLENYFGCDGSIDEVVDSRTCEMDMLPIFLDLGIDTLLQCRVRARNDNGWGVWSNFNEAGPESVEKIPGVMDQPWCVWTNETVIEIGWMGMDDETIIAYEIQWDQGEEVWTHLADIVDENVETWVQKGLDTDVTYRYRMRAVNFYGPAAEYSDPVDCTTRVIEEPQLPPEQPGAPITKLRGRDVQVSWPKPFDNGHEITSYDVYIRDKDGVDQLETENCTQDDHQYLATCYIPMEDLWTEPFFLQQDFDVVAVVVANNANGASEKSDPSVDSAIVQTKPHQMDQPQLVPLTSNDQIKVQWTPVSNPKDGGSPVTTYRLELAIGQGKWSTVAGGDDKKFLQTSYTVANAMENTEYRFRVSARNMWGWSKVSSEERVWTQSKVQPAIQSPFFDDRDREETPAEDPEDDLTDEEEWNQLIAAALELLQNPQGGNTSTNGGQ